ncbi:putative acetyl transferase protein [Janibacter sp. HTCC2649]|nr:putative acetyl transferase protein [Janibacter sp. HTCC2649]
MVVVGAGGFGREVASLLFELRSRGVGFGDIGVVDDRPSMANRARLHSLGVPLIGTVDDLVRNCRETPVVLAIGSATARRAIADRLSVTDATFPILVHPQASVGAGVTLGEGSVICAGARLSAQIRVGRHVHVDQNATVGHDCDLEDFVRLNPQSCVSGDVTLETGSLVGANATILQGLRVGGHTLVGAGAVVTHDLPAGVVASGVPARVHARVVAAQAG